MLIIPQSWCWPYDLKHKSMFRLYEKVNEEIYQYIPWNNKTTISDKYPTRTADLARVIPTFIRRASDTNPILLSSFDLTHENIATSFSRPWQVKVFHIYELVLYYFVEFIICFFQVIFGLTRPNIGPSTEPL